MSIIISEAIQKARKLRLELGIGENDTVNIMDILKYKENISILKLKLSDSFSGMILIKGDGVEMLEINSYEKQLNGLIIERDELIDQINELKNKIEQQEITIDKMKKCDNCGIRPCDTRYKNKVCKDWTVK